jgi:DNA-binding CsgD family transcriptional regulator
MPQTQRLVQLITDGYAAGTPAVRRAIRAFRDGAVSAEERIRWLFVVICSTDLTWDDENRHREAISQLASAPVRAELARAHLLYGEWLRRERRRGEAREQLRIAPGMLEKMRMNAFAERARRELLATSEHGRPRPVAAPLPRGPGTRAGAAAGETLTAQEAQVARLARDGLSNPEIATRLFISPRTVQHHLSKVFAKLGISSRGELHRVLPGDPDHGAPLS